jgi:CRP-like cAMP-binding protein
MRVSITNIILINLKNLYLITITIIVYFVAKGTISFSLSKEYLEKEIKEVKKNNNFGEIEMCLNEKLTYNIKVKSRNCELFVLKKNVS